MADFAGAWQHSMREGSGPFFTRVRRCCGCEAEVRRQQLAARQVGLGSVTGKCASAAKGAHRIDSLFSCVWFFSNTEIGMGIICVQRANQEVARGAGFIPQNAGTADPAGKYERLFAIQPSCGLKSALRSLAQRSS